uniref:Uncharacterized protein n=1 Tax=Wuchereria bancrofti TaxID=6293 RepID=A0A1I8EV20_WUCBA
MDIVKSSLLMRQLTLSHDTSTKQTEMTQQQIKIAALGLRKRLSLAIITCCYFAWKKIHNDRLEKKKSIGAENFEDTNIFYFLTYHLSHTKIRAYNSAIQ